MATDEGTSGVNRPIAAASPVTWAMQALVAEGQHCCRGEAEGRELYTRAMKALEAAESLILGQRWIETTVGSGGLGMRCVLCSRYTFGGGPVFHEQDCALGAMIEALLGGSVR